MTEVMLRKLTELTQKPTGGRDELGCQSEDNLVVLV